MESGSGLRVCLKLDIERAGDSRSSNVAFLCQQCNMFTFGDAELSPCLLVSFAPETRFSTSGHCCPDISSLSLPTAVG